MKVQGLGFITSPLHPTQTLRPEAVNPQEGGPKPNKQQQSHQGPNLKTLKALKAPLSQTGNPADKNRLKGGNGAILAAVCRGKLCEGIAAALGERIGLKGLEGLGLSGFRV